ncbi:MAG: hypothetical protein KGL39_18925 [Patescibacteria group bacterium]|nr:hypothetical protein [Patescibacteria group bacterium]
MRLYADIETYWTPDLTKVGTMRCATDPSAGLNCIGFGFDDNQIDVAGYHQCKDLAWFQALVDKADSVVFHNAQFEVTVFGARGVIIPWHKVVDTMAKAAYYGYARSLDNAAKALKCSKLKDISGKSAMLKLVSGKHTPEDSPADFQRLYSYCAIDVEVMREIDRKLPDLPPEIQQRWIVDMEINARGVPVDEQAITNAVWLRNAVCNENDARMRELTGGAVETVNQVDELLKWLERGNVRLPDMKADTVAKALKKSLPDWARAALELRQEAALSSLAKYEKMQAYAVNGRLHQMHDWYGAHTGRPTGSGPQVLNLPRAEDSERWAELLSTNPRWFYHVDKPAERLKEALRGTICAPPGYTLVGCDLSQIEARVTGWLAGEQKLLDLFTTSDPYCTYGETIFGRKITKKENPIERTAAKASMLSLGFAGGIGAYQRVAENYKIDFAMVAQVVLPSATAMERSEGERSYEYYIGKSPAKPLSKDHAIACDILKQRYRRDFANIVAYWDTLEAAFLYGGQAGRISVEVRDGNLRVVTLPSGRQLFYHGFKVNGRGEYGYQGRWGWTALWKGTLIENMAQAINADVSDWYKIRANYTIAPVVHHCYDEFTMEAYESEAQLTLRQLQDLTKNARPPWADGLPIAFDYWSAKRYGK